jgi:hypothetical protein
VLEPRLAEASGQTKRDHVKKFIAKLGDALASQKRRRAFFGNTNEHEIEQHDGNEQQQEHTNEHEMKQHDGKRLLVPLSDLPHKRIGGFSCHLPISITTDQMCSKHKQKNGRKKRDFDEGQNERDFNEGQHDENEQQHEEPHENDLHDENEQHENEPKKRKRAFKEGQNERQHRIQVARGKLLIRAFTA